MPQYDEQTNNKREPMWPETVFHKLNYVLIALVSLGLAPYLDLFEQYVFNDWQFVITVAVLLIVDTVTGVWKGWRAKQLSSYKFRDSLKKAALYFLLVIIANVASRYTVQGETNILLQWVDNTIYALITITELISILENMGALGVAIPKWLLTRLRDFTETGAFEPHPRGAQSKFKLKETGDKNPINTSSETNTQTTHEEVSRTENPRNGGADSPNIRG